MIRSRPFSGGFCRQTNRKMIRLTRDPAKGDGSSPEKVGLKRLKAKKNFKMSVFVEIERIAIFLK